MTDQLYLSLWLAPGLKNSRLRHFTKLLQTFPFSQRAQPQSSVSVQAVGAIEPPLLERLINGPINPADVAAMFQEYAGQDIAYQLESWWDLWQFDGDWKLAPARVALSCFGPEYDNGTSTAPADQEDLRIDFGVDTYFLPHPELTGSARMVESNIKSLLRLVHEVESILPVERRKLETESGENFADRLQSMLASDWRM